MSRSCRRRFVALSVVCVFTLQVTPVDATPSGGALPPSLSLILPVAGGFGVPADAVGVAMNVTVTEAMGPGFLTVYPCGDRPLASNLNYVAGQTVPNFVVAGLDADGDVCIDTLATTDVVVDIAGYIPAGSPLVPLPAPQRFVDTRNGLGVPMARVAPGTVLSVPLAGGFGVPADAETVIFNATAVQPSGNGFVTVFPCGQSVPETSSLNFQGGAIVPNLVISAVGTGGAVCFFASVETDIVADVAAFVPSDGTGFVTLDRPHRLVDTRIALGGPGDPLGPSTRSVAVGGLHGVPIEASAAIVNLTATDGTDDGYLSAFPCGGPAPLTSNLNFGAGTPVANLAIVKLGDRGTMCMRAMVAVDAVVDVLGYVHDAAAFVALNPSRMFDSREGVDPPCGIAVFLNGNPLGDGVFQLTQPGSSTAQPLPDQAAWEGPRAAYIDQSCRISLVGISGGYLWVDEYSSAGAHLRGFRPAAWWAQPYAMSPTVNGLIGLGPGPGIGTNVTGTNGTSKTIVDVTTGETIASLPDNQTLSSGMANTWSWLGATDDGSLIAVWRYDDRGHVEMWYFSGDGSVLGYTTLPAGALPIEISPTGTYLAMTTGNPLRNLTVTTLLGAPVATLPGATAAWFMTDGSVATCVDPPGSAPLQIKRWDLFSPPRPLAGSAWPTSCRIEDVR